MSSLLHFTKQTISVSDIQITAEYTHELVSLAGDVDLNLQGGPVVNASAVLGHGPYTVGRYMMGTGTCSRWVSVSAKNSVADPDPGSGAFLPQGSGIRIRDSDPGSGSGIRNDFFSGSRISDPGSLPFPNSGFYL
jgi:hypothetical protein